MKTALSMLTGVGLFIGGMFCVAFTEAIDPVPFIEILETCKPKE